MPIRFRCPNCETLLSIARRKAGTEIVCPKCTDEVLVPSAEAQDDEPEIDLADEAATAAAPDPVLRGSGVLTSLQKKAGANGHSKSDFSMPKSTLTPPTPVPQVTDVPIVAGEDGMYLGRGTIAILVILVLALAGLAFATGYYTGR
jgi:DNA-directed RNA polymerase subunit M/transcription elongation factor TFIIS